MPTQIDDAWWAVARSEEVTAKKPLSVDIGDQPLVLWRDNAGIARALEDRCPHRRAPLSRGCVRPNGWLQCGYHGWSYDGETGRVKEIPNLKGEQRFPPLYKAKKFSVAEAGGFVRVALEERAPPPAPLQAMPLSGTAHIAIDQDRYLDALFDDPGLVIGLRGVGFTPYLASELQEKEGRLVMERYCQWRPLRWPAPFSSDFPLTLLSRTDPVTGETELTLRDDALREVVSAVLAPVPAARGVTAVRWRARVGDRLEGAAKIFGVGNPLRVRDAIDAAKLRKLLPSNSLHGVELRAAAAKTREAA